MSNFKDAFKDTPAETGFALIEVGTYEAEIMDCQLDLTKEPARLSLTLALTQEPVEGRKVFVNYSLEGRGLGFLKKDLDTLGLNYESVGSPEDIADLLWNALPVPVVVYIAQKEWQGKMYNNCYINECITNAQADRPAALEKEPAKPATKAAATKPAAKTTPKNHAPTKTTKRQAREPNFDESNDPPF